MPLERTPKNLLDESEWIQCLMDGACSVVAQLAEPVFCKHQVAGSTPVHGSFY